MFFSLFPCELSAEIGFGLDSVFPHHFALSFKQVRFEIIQPYETNNSLAICVFYDHYSVVTFQTMTYDIFYRLVAFAKCKNLNKKSSPLLYAAFLINQLIRFHMQALFIHSLDADTFK